MPKIPEYLIEIVLGIAFVIAGVYVINKLGMTPFYL